MLIYISRYSQRDAKEAGIKRFHLTYFNHLPRHTDGSIFCGSRETIKCSFPPPLYFFQLQEQNVGLAAPGPRLLGRTAGASIQLGQHEQHQGGAGLPHQVCTSTIINISTCWYDVQSSPESDGAHSPPAHLFFLSNLFTYSLWPPRPVSSFFLPRPFLLLSPSTSSSL